MASHNTYERQRNKLQHKSIDLFSHSEELSSIDSNSFNVIMVRDSPHPQRVWRVKTDIEQYSLFKQSDIVQDFKRIHGDKYITPSLSTFLRNRCKCIRKPTMMSCVDVNTSALTHYMKAVDRFIAKNKSVQDKLNQCSCPQHSTIPKMSQWQNHLSGRYHNLIEPSCCPKQSHPN